MPGRLLSEIAGLTRGVHLPRSGAQRSDIAYLKLLQVVKVDKVWGGFRFEGRLLRPGETVAEDELRPDRSWPEPPVLLECAGPTGEGWGHRRRPTLYLLWRYDPAAGEFRELARVASENRDWTLDLGPPARRALQPPRPLLVDPAGAAARVSVALDHELEPLDRPARKIVLLAVYDRLASRLILSSFS